MGGHVGVVPDANALKSYTEQRTCRCCGFTNDVLVHEIPEEEIDFVTKPDSYVMLKIMTVILGSALFGAVSWYLLLDPNTWERGFVFGVFSGMLLLLLLVRSMKNQVVDRHASLCKKYNLDPTKVALPNGWGKPEVILPYRYDHRVREI